MSEEQMEPMLDRVRESYNVPPETPREDMWASISARLASDPGTDQSAHGSTDPGVIDLAAVRRQRMGPSHQAMGWAVAAAAVLVLGVGIGRMTVPSAPVDVAVTTRGAQPTGLALAAQDHLGRTESLLTMVRADARAGRVDPGTAEWAHALLAQTRLLIDAQQSADPTVNDLMLDLELVLIQIVGVTETGSMDEARARTELELALRSLDDGEVLSRIQAALPTDMSGV